jgi:flagellar assembly factor FliW
MPVLKTKRFGELTYDERDVIDLPEGLIGLPQFQRWLLLEMDRNVPMQWLQSLDHGDFGLPITAPGFFSQSYEVIAPAEVRGALGAPEDEELATLIITTIQPGGASITGNLLAPLLVSAQSRRGVQVILEDDSLPVRQELDYAKFNLAVESMSKDNKASTPTADESEAAERESHAVSFR